MRMIQGSALRIRGLIVDGCCIFTTFNRVDGRNAALGAMRLLFVPPLPILVNGHDFYAVWRI